MQQTAGSDGDAFEISSLAFGKERIEGERALPGTTYSGNDHQPSCGDIDRDVLQIVCAAPRMRMNSELLGGFSGWDMGMTVEGFRIPLRGLRLCLG
jgi:hypothetical protein